ncbi:MAG TPA: hypothetical protein VEL47_06870 [Myxococcota bacterium]|nr:hypothetical protein [Myxococcota bacterium]
MRFCAVILTVFLFAFHVIGADSDFDYRMTPLGERSINGLVNYETPSFKLTGGLILGGFGSLAVGATACTSACVLGNETACLLISIISGTLTAGGAIACWIFARFTSDNYHAALKILKNRARFGEIVKQAYIAVNDQGPDRKQARKEIRKYLNELYPNWQITYGILGDVITELTEKWVMANEGGVLTTFEIFFPEIDLPLGEYKNSKGAPRFRFLRNRTDDQFMGSLRNFEFAINRLLDSGDPDFLSRDVLKRQIASVRKINEVYEQMVKQSEEEARAFTEKMTANLDAFDMSDCDVRED